MESQQASAEPPPVPTLAAVFADEALSAELYEHAKRSYNQETIDFYRAVERYRCVCPLWRRPLTRPRPPRPSISSFPFSVSFCVSGLFDTLLIATL